MRILHAYPEFVSKGGRPHDCRQIVNHIAKRGHVVCAVGVERPEEQGRVYPDESVNVRFASTSVIRSNSFGTILKDFQPDFVHFTGGPRIPVQNGWAKKTRRMGIPYAVSACGNLSQPTYYHRWGNKKNHFYHPWLKRLFFRVFDHPLIRNAAFVHATSESEGKIAIDFGAQKTRVVPFGIDDAWVRKSARSVNPAHVPTTFTYLGRLSIVHKGLDIIMDAFGRLQKQGYGDRVRLVMAGTSENGSMDQLKIRARKLGLNNVEFPGGVWADEKEALWNRTHYFLHMCRFNGFALATREALGQGIPIIATMESDFGDWVNRFGMGSVVDISAESLASRIASLLDESDKYPRLVDGVNRYVAHTSWQNVADQLIAAYTEIVETRENRANTDSHPVTLSA